MQGNQAVYPWQESIWQNLSGYISQQRIPQALLFTGAAGLGKRHLADTLASVLLCLQTDNTGVACGLCAACKLYQAQTHPDYLCIEPDEPGKAIGIDKVRTLIDKLALKPQFAAYRTVIFQPADQLTTNSANAFLKSLEEPTERTCIIMISEQPSILPATIRSRCQHIHFPAVTYHQASDWLKQQGVNEDLELLLKMANSSPLLAARYAKEQWLQLRREYFQAWLDIAHGKGNYLAVADNWQKQERIGLAVVLDWLCNWILDLVKLASGIDINEIANTDFKKPLQALAEQLELNVLYQYYDTVLRSKSKLATPVNKQLLTESLLIDWLQLNKT